MDEVVIIKNSKFALAMSFMVGAVVGGFATASLVRKAMQEEMSEQIEIEFEKIRASYAAADNMTKPWSSPTEAVKVLHPDEELPTKVVGFQEPETKPARVAYDKIRTFEPNEEAPADAIDATGVVTPPELVEEAQDIYEITSEVYGAGEKNHVQESLWYYPEDGVVTDGNDNKIDNPEKFLGTGFAMKFGKDPEPYTLYVRNEKVQIDYEILMAKGQSWERDVAGLVDDEPSVQTDRERINGA